MQTKRFYADYVIVPGETEPYPIAWERVFGRIAPLAVEIGFGNGDFLVDWSLQQPGWNFIGIELSVESMMKLQKSLHQHKIGNTRAIREEAGFALREFFSDNSLRHVMMNFPDPWPKGRHKDRRLLSGDFVHTLGAVLENGGQYELVTDQQWYAAHARALFQASPSFRIEPIETDPVRPIATRYECKWRDMGRSTYRLTARKVQNASIHRLLEDSAMPHAFIEKEIHLDSIEKLIGVEYIEAGIFFVVKAVFGSPDGSGYLLRVITKDGHYKQGFYITVSRHEDHRWLVKLDTTFQPYRTPAVKLAVWKIGEMLNCA